MEKNMKKRPHDFLWRGFQMESKLMPGKEVTQQCTHNSKTFDLGRGAYQTVIYAEQYGDEGVPPHVAVHEAGNASSSCVC